MQRSFRVTLFVRSACPCTMLPRAPPMHPLSALRTAGQGHSKNTMLSQQRATPANSVSALPARVDVRQTTGMGALGRVASSSDAGVTVSSMRSVPGFNRSNKRKKSSKDRTYTTLPMNPFEISITDNKTNPSLALSLIALFLEVMNLLSDSDDF